MTKEQEEAIEKLKQKLKPSKYGGYCVLGYNKKYCFGKSDFEAIETVLSMLQEQQEENKKKDKIIDYMIDWIRERSIYAVDSHDMLKQYFERKVEEK